MTDNDLKALNKLSENIRNTEYLFYALEHSKVILRKPNKKERGLLGLFLEYKTMVLGTDDRITLPDEFIFKFKELVRNYLFDLRKKFDDYKMEAPNDR
jgi:hypothetical protein